MSSLDSSPKSFNIIDILEKYKQSKMILSPLPLESFKQVVQQGGLGLLQQYPEIDSTHFIPFKQLNQDAIDELQRSLQQSKNMWNVYGRALFSDSPIEKKVSKKTELLHNRDAYYRIKKQSSDQLKLQLEGVNKEYQKIHVETQGVKSYPSISVKDQFRQLQLKRQLQMGCSVDLVRQETELAKQQVETTKSRLLNEVKKQTVYIHRTDHSHWNPSSREGSALVNYNDRLYLYGGQGAGFTADLNCAIIDKQFFKWEMVKMKSKDQCRSHHTANIYKNQLIIFGGVLYSPQRDQRVHCEVSSEVVHINLTNFDVKIVQHAGIVTPRKAHIAESVGRQLLIQGGIDSRGRYLNDFIVYDILTQRWVSVEISTSIYPDGIAFHKSCAALEHKHIDLYKHDPDASYDNQGVYMFGGFDSNGHYLDKFYKIDVRRRPLFVEELQPKGRGPIGRCQHSMCYLETTQQIVIYGGKNDDINSQGFLNDLHMYEIRNCSWSQVEMKGFAVPGRCSHSAAIVESKLYIFGGINYSGFVKSDFLVIELNQEKAHDLGQYEAYTERQEQPHVTFKPSTPVKTVANLKQQIEQIRQDAKLLDRTKKQSIARHSRYLSEALTPRKFTTSENLEYIDKIQTWVDLSNLLITLAPHQHKQFSKELRDKLRNGYYKRPAPIQKMVLPYLLQEKTEERFVYIKSPTGTGKTLAFILPILFFFDMDNIQQFYQPAAEGPVQYYPYAIILVATHALLAQIQKDFSGATPDSLSKMGFKVQHFDKGQDESIINGHVLCGVPHTILRLIKKNTINLKNVRFVVVDEADNTIANDKNLQVIQIIARFLESNNLRWKIICCGATMETVHLREIFIKELKDKRQNAKKSQQEMINQMTQLNTIEEDFFKFKYFNFEITLENIYHYYDSTAFSEDDLLQRMVFIIKDTLNRVAEAQIMIFFNAKSKCTETKQLLMRDPTLDFLVKNDLICEIIQENLQAYQSAEEMRKAQQKIVDEFCNGNYKIMFCSDLMGRGMNFRKVRLVINYGAPRQTPNGDFDIRRYNQRVGRTGRMEDLGVALTLLNQNVKPESPEFAEGNFISNLKAQEPKITIKPYDTQEFIKQLKDVYEKTNEKNMKI